MTDYADYLEDKWQAQADLAEDAEEAGMTPGDYQAMLEERRADSVRSRQQDEDDL